MGQSDSLEHLPDVHRHQGGAEWLGQVPEGLEHLDPPGNRERAIFSETKLLGWVRMIVLNILLKSTDIRLKLSDWDRPLGVWTI